MALSSEELAALNALEDQEARGVAVSWDEPKSVRGVLVREIETITFQDKRDGQSKTKRVATVRTADGLVSIFEGPVALNRRLFDGERYDDAPLGPPHTGDLLIVNYLGERTSLKTGSDFKAFDVFRHSTADGPVTMQKAEEIDESDAPDDEPASSQISNSDDLPF